MKHRTLIVDVWLEFFNFSIDVLREYIVAYGYC